MNTYESRKRAPKVVFGAIAVAATMATLGLTVAGPAALSQSDAVTQTASNTAARPVVVVDLGTINVVGKRTKTARADSPYLPASYRVR